MAVEETAYATLTDLQNYLGEPPPANASIYLLRASRALNKISQISWIWDPWRPRLLSRNLGVPSEEEIAYALMLATCMQIEYWMEQGGGEIDDSQDILRLKQSGRLDGETMPALPQIAPRAVDTLQFYGVWRSGPVTGLYWGPTGNRHW